MESDGKQRLPDQVGAAITFSELADRYLASNPRRRRPEALAKEAEMIEGELRPVFGPRPASEISREDAEVLVEDMVRRGSEVWGAEQTRIVAATVLKFGVEERLIDDNPLSINYGVPRAWSVPLLGLSALMLIGAAQEGLTSGNANAIRFGVLVPIWMTWRVWTKKGKYSPFSLANVFAVDGKRISAAHLIVWVVGCMLVLIMLLGAVGEARAQPPT